MKTDVLETWSPQHSGLRPALADFEPIARRMKFGAAELEGSMPVTTPTLADMSCVAFVYADPHQDLPYPRWTLLAPVLMRPGARLSVEDAGGQVRTIPLEPGALVIFDSHSKHWVDKPGAWPSDEAMDTMDPVAKDALKREHLSVMLSFDSPQRPTREEAERRVASALHLEPAPGARPKMRR